MDLALFGRYFLDFALLYPSAFLCLASLWEKLRTPRRTACIAAGCITLLCIGCAALCAVFGLNSNSLLPAIVLVSFWLLRWRVTPEVTVSQTAFLFSISAVMMAVCSLLSTLLNAQTEISNPQTVCLASTALLRLGLALPNTGRVAAAAPTAGAAGPRPALLPGLGGQRALDGKGDLAVLPNAEHLDLYLLALGEDRGKVLDKAVGNFGNVHHAGFALGQRHKRAELFHAGDFSLENRSYL